MKQFHELTEAQRHEAVKFAKSELSESLRIGILTTSRVWSDEDISRLAIEAAENGTYNDEGKPLVSQMDVPWVFLGGCV